MTAMPTSTAHAVSDPATVPRFGPTERAVHWIHAAAFFALLATGLALYLPVLATLVGDRPLLKAVHLGTAGLWLTALLALSVGGDRRRLRRTRQELERFTDDDLVWLRGGPAPSGRFNAGQKLHAILQAALAALFVITGVLLWLGERDTALRIPGTIPVHDGCMFLATALVAGHLYLAVVHPATRPALRGMTAGRVAAAFAREHHAAWTPEPERPWRPSTRARVVALLVVVAGVAVTAAIALP